MKTCKIDAKRWYSLLLILVGFALITGCAPKIKLQILQPAEVDTSGIVKVAVGSFELVKINRIFKIERNGRWQTKNIELSSAQKKAISKQIRARVVNLLATTPYFQLVYTDEFQALENDAALQKAIAAGGFQVTEVNAVINGKIWLDVVNIDGVELDKVELEYVQGGREGSFNYTVQSLVFWPYKSVRGTLALELKLTRLNPTEVIAVTFDTRQYSHKLGGKPADLQEQIRAGAQMLSTTIVNNQAEQQENVIEESDLVLPNFEQIVADMAESIAAQFIRRVSITQKSVSYPIATGGNASARMLIEAGAYNKAIDTLTGVLDSSVVKNPDDLYNLGLSYEASGDFGLAAVSYNDAIQADPVNLIYAQGLGRIEQMRRGNRRLREQLASKP